MPRPQPIPGPPPLDISEWGVLRLWTLRPRGEGEPQIMWTYVGETPQGNGYAPEDWLWSEKAPQKVDGGMEVDENGDIFTPDPLPPAEALALAAPHLAPLIDALLAQTVAEAMRQTGAILAATSAGFSLPAPVAGEGFEGPAPTLQPSAGGGGGGVFVPGPRGPGR